MGHATSANDRHADNHWGILALFAVLMYAAGGLGGLVTFPEIDGWYATLAKPSYTPPNGIFTPVWNTIFAFTAISTWMVWRRVGVDKPWVAAFAVQWIANVGWSVVFFKLHQPGTALFVMAVLWIAVAAMLTLHWRVRPLAGALLLPYLAWVSFASAVNFGVWRLNA
jgi:benzodiazapine receptor